MDDYDCDHPEERVIVDWAAGDRVCTACGVVLEGHIIDERPDWTRGGGMADPHAAQEKCTGANQGSHERLLGWASTVEIDTSGSKKRVLPQRVLAKAATTDDSARRTVVQGFGMVKRLASDMRLPAAACEAAQELFRDYAEVKDARGETKGKLVAVAALYFGLKLQKQCGVSRGEHEMAAACEVNLSELTKMTKAMRKALAGKAYGKAMCEPFTPADIIMRFATAVMGVHAAEAKQRVILRAQRLNETAKGQALMVGKQPKTVCCALLVHALRKEAVKTTDKQKVCAAILHHCGVNVSANAVDKCLKTLEEMEAASTSTA